MVGFKNRGLLGLTVQCTSLVAGTNEATRRHVFPVFFLVLLRHQPRPSNSIFVTQPSHPIQTRRGPATPAYLPFNCSQICGICCVRVLMHGLGPRELAHGIGGPGRRTLTESAQDGASIRVSPKAFWEGRRRDSEDIISIAPFAASVCFLLLVLSRPCSIFIQCRYIRGYIASRVCLQPFASDHLL